MHAIWSSVHNSVEENSGVFSKDAVDWFIILILMSAASAEISPKQSVPV